MSLSIVPPPAPATQEPAFDQEAEQILQPVRGLLLRLKDATPDKLPPSGTFLKTKTQMQIVTERLVPIGEHIMSVVKDMEPGAGTRLELKLW
jgi:hypothetical protein